MNLRIAVALVVSGVVVGAGGVALAVSRGGDVVTPQPVVGASKDWRVGPSARYSGDTGAIGEVRPLRIVVPDDASSYDGVVDVSLSYVTPRGGRGELSLGFEEIGVDPGDDGTADDAEVAPGVVDLPAARTGAVVSVQFRVTGLDAGTSWKVAPELNGGGFGGSGFAIRSSDVVLAVDLVPTS